MADCPGSAILQELQGLEKSLPAAMSDPSLNVRPDGLSEFLFGRLLCLLLVPLKPVWESGFDSPVLGGPKFCANTKVLRI